MMFLDRRVRLQYVIKTVSCAWPAKENKEPKRKAFGFGRASKKIAYKEIVEYGYDHSGKDSCPAFKEKRSSTG